MFSYGNALLSSVIGAFLGMINGKLFIVQHKIVFSSIRPMHVHCIVATLGSFFRLCINLLGIFCIAPLASFSLFFTLCGYLGFSLYSFKKGKDL